MMKDRFISILLSVIIVAICLVGAKCTHDYRTEIKRLEDNQKELLKQDSTSTTLVSKSKSETKQMLGEYGQKVLDDLAIKPSKVKYITEIREVTKIDTVVEVKEIVIHDTVVQCFQFVDGYLTFGGEIKNGKLDFEMSMRDSLAIVAHKQKKKFLFIPYYSRKNIEIDIKNANPYTKIVYGRNIVVQ